MGIEPTLVAWEGPSPAQSNSLPPLTSRQIFEPPDRRDPTWGEFHAGASRCVRWSGTIRTGRREIEWVIGIGPTLVAAEPHPDFSASLDSEDHWRSGPEPPFLPV